jgi:hypothetical protein
MKNVYRDFLLGIKHQQSDENAALKENPVHRGHCLEVLGNFFVTHA